MQKGRQIKGGKFDVSISRLILRVYSYTTIQSITTREFGVSRYTRKMPSSEGDAGGPQTYPHGPPTSQQMTHPGMSMHQPRYPPPYGGHMHPPTPHVPYHYGGHPPPSGQYGPPTGPPPPHSHQWSGGMPPGTHTQTKPPAAYPQPGQRSLSPDRSGNWNSYRGPPPHKTSRKSPKGEGDDEAQYWHIQRQPPGPGGPPPPYHGGQYGPPSAGWQGGHPPPQMHSVAPPTAAPILPPQQTAQLYGGGSWNSGKTTPRRQRPESYAPRHEIDASSHYSGPSRGGQLNQNASTHDDDGATSSTGISDKDKHRGSYKCGRVSSLFYCCFGC